MPRGKKATEVKKIVARKNRVVERVAREVIQVIDPDEAPGGKALIDLPKGQANGGKKK